MISSIEQKGEQEKLPLIREYKAKIEDELLEICNDILSIIETELIPNSTSEEGKVFYYKMKGDYHRYLAEFQVRLLVCAMHLYTSESDIRFFELWCLLIYPHQDARTCLQIICSTCSVGMKQVSEKRRESSDAALASYKCATDIAEHDLPPTHPIRLGLALNFSVFFYEIYNSPVRLICTCPACEVVATFRHVTWTT